MMSAGSSEIGIQTGQDVFKRYVQKDGGGGRGGFRRVEERGRSLLLMRIGRDGLELMLIGGTTDSP